MSIRSFFSKILDFFRGGKAEAAFNVVADLIPKALPIIQTIAKLTPTRTDDEIVEAFVTFGVPANVSLIRSTPAPDRGYLLLRLASTALARQYPTVATNVINSAVQLAVTGHKAA